jgi:2-polyprenyl-3-methyl-5-hydroxy-6-metoxy-1,4-benzoquinol methylase
MTESHDEMSFLESVTGTYVTSESPQDRAIKTMAMRAFGPFLRTNGSALELGCCDGFMTSLISPLVRDVHVVDGSQTFLEATRKRGLPNVSFEHSLFETFSPDRRFDFIFACYVLEHVMDAADLLQRIRGLLTDDGLAFIVVPNARAMSRQLARHMGLLDDLYALTPNDINHGHRRVYDRQSLNQGLQRAGLAQTAQGGLMLKPLADFQMNQLMDSGILGPSQLDGLYQMGLEYPDLAGSLFSVCRRG